MKVCYFLLQRSLNKIMDKKIIFLIAGIVIVLVLIVVFNKEVYKSPEECTHILGEGKIGITFLGDIELAKEYAQFLINSEPFSNFKEDFSFYQTGISECKIIDNNILFCYNKNSVKNAANCPTDYIVALSDSGNSRSSAYGNFISLNIKQPKSVLLHEFGHAFGNLADEYVPSSIPRGSRNCQKTCDKFIISEGCFGGCSKSDYFRSSSSSVMRTLSTSNYGELNLELLKNELQKI